MAGSGKTGTRTGATGQGQGRKSRIAKRTVYWGETAIVYEFERKAVKNMNLRIRPDGSIHVSVGRGVPASAADAFVRDNGERILAVLERFARTASTRVEPPRFTDAQCRGLFEEILEEVYPPFGERGIPKPQLRIRHMKSRWGSCIPGKGVITMNSRLLGAPRSCVEYVMAHELCHFIHPNHSSAFYGELSKCMPDWRERKALLQKCADRL